MKTTLEEKLKCVLLHINEGVPIDFFKAKEKPSHVCGFFFIYYMY